MYLRGCSLVESGIWVPLRVCVCVHVGTQLLVGTQVSSPGGGERESDHGDNLLPGHRARDRTGCRAVPWEPPRSPGSCSR